MMVILNFMVPRRIKKQDKKKGFRATVSNIRLRGQNQYSKDSSLLDSIGRRERGHKFGAF